MILVDTPVWVDHFHKPDADLEQLLRTRQVLIHPFIIGEMALGSFPMRAAILRRMSALRRARVARDEEVLHLIDDWQLYGSGIGYGDAQLLSSVLLTSGSLLWTRDRPLRKVAQQLSLAADLS